MQNPTTPQERLFCAVQTSHGKSVKARRYDPYMVNEETLELLAEILDNIESIDKVALTLDESKQSVNVEIQNLDAPWFRRLIHLAASKPKLA